MEPLHKPVTLRGPEGPVTIRRTDTGIPEISGGNLADASFGLGWAHACDRQLQVLLTRVLVQGRAAEKLSPAPELVEIDAYMRKMNFLPDPERVYRGLGSDMRRFIEAYVAGFNRFLADHGPVWELSLLGYKPEPLAVRDVLVIAKIMGFLGLADAQGNMEKLIVQMIQNDVADDKLRELFPYLTDRFDRDLIKKIRLEAPLSPAAVRWLGKIPKFVASNNWVVAGERTASGKPMLCNDPHLEVNRIPAIWYEAVIRLPDDYGMGATIPGVPGIMIGRNRNLSWGITFAFMDAIDYRIEQCRDGKFRRGNAWKPFRVREEIINRKGKEPVVKKYYANELGTLEGDPFVEGYYLVQCWSAAGGCGEGDINGQGGLMQATSVREGMKLLEQVDAGSWNFVLADREGNIGYRMTGRTFARPAGVSGLIPHPAWEAKYDSRGFIPKKKLPSLYNPREGFITTANQDLNHLGSAKPINLPMASYRAERIADLLRRGERLDTAAMKRIHDDRYSLQAERFMKLLGPLLPDTDNGRLLAAWDRTYTADSRAASLFESVYLELLKIVFGEGGMGREVVEHLMRETSLFNDYYGNFDAILLRGKSAWFNGKKREELLGLAIERGLAVKPQPYGKTRRVIFAHLLFGGKLPRLFGFDRGPFSLPGNRATVPQGQIFRSAGRTTTFSPSYRFIADLGTDELHTNLPGGVRDRRFSRLYLNDLGNWFRGIYKVLR